VIILALVVFIVLARLLRSAFALVGNMLSSAGSVFAVLIGLLGAGTLLLTTVVTVMFTR